MKSITSIMFATALILGLAGVTVSYGQTVAIGHVSAEVIESVSVSTQAATDLAIGAGTGATTVDLGAMTVNSGSNYTVNVVVAPTTISDALGNSFILDPVVNSTDQVSVAQVNGSQIIDLNGTANLASGQASGQYKGSYTVVFAYN
jgi:hypothetical protein